MKRLATVLAVLTTWPLLTAGGGVNPPPPGFKITGPAVSATIVVDPHIASDNAGQTSIRLSKGVASSGAAFTIDPSTRAVLFTFGCVPERTAIRFGSSQPLVQWGLPAALLPSLFTPLGITVSTGVTGDNVLVITDVDSAVCTADPTNTLGSGDVAPGTLSFTAVIQFLVPQH